MGNGKNGEAGCSVGPKHCRGPLLSPAVSRSEPLSLLQSWPLSAARGQAPEELCAGQQGTPGGMCRSCRDSGPPLSGLVDIRTPPRGKGVQLVKEEHAGCSGLGPVKELPHSTLTLPNIPAGREDRIVDRFRAYSKGH